MSKELTDFLEGEGYFYLHELAQMETWGIAFSVANQKRIRKGKVIAKLLNSAAIAADNHEQVPKFLTELIHRFQEKNRRDTGKVIGCLTTQSEVFQTDTLLKIRIEVQQLTALANNSHFISRSYQERRLQALRDGESLITEFSALVRILSEACEIALSEKI